jgi:hypothetical protein
LFSWFLGDLYSNSFITLIIFRGIDKEPGFFARSMNLCKPGKSIGLLTLLSSLTPHPECCARKTEPFIDADGTSNKFEPTKIAKAVAENKSIQRYLLFVV